MSINKDTLPEFNRKLLDKKPRNKLWNFINTCGKLKILIDGEWVSAGRHIKLYEIAGMQHWFEVKNERSRRRK